MRNEMYYFFYDTLKRFVKDEEFSIVHKFLNGQTIVTFNKEDNEFYYHNYVIKIETEEVYKIIKAYVDELIRKMQRAAFSEAKYVYESVSLTAEEYEIFCILEERFKPFLWEEVIVPQDIGERGCYHRLAFGFEELAEDVPIKMLRDVLKTLHNSPEIFSNGEIYSYMWVKSAALTSKSDFISYIEKLAEKGYMTIMSKNADEYPDVKLTEKFYEAFKKSFYYDYDPKVRRPSGCIYC